jgi:hypothetical protein
VPGEKVVSRDWWERNSPDYKTPWRPGELDLEKQNGKVRKPWYERFQAYLLKSVFILLILRFIVWAFSLIGLILASTILQYYNIDPNRQPTTSTVIAIAVNGTALIYLIYQMADEFYGKPLGLRSPLGKTRLLLLDLFFIVFQGANLSLQFDAVAANNDCELYKTPDPSTGPGCPAVIAKLPSQEALASVILIALVAWMFTFVVSVLR